MNKTLLVAALALFLGACGGSDKKAQSAQGGNQAAASESANTPLAATNELNLYIWSDYSDPSTVTQFGKDNKLTINESFYDSNEMLEAKVLTGKSGYDLVAPSLSNVARQINAGAYRPIDKSQIPNYNNIDPSLLKMMAQVDPGNQYAVPYFWGINTLAINTDLVTKHLGTDKLPENEWDLVFNPEYTQKLKHCGISFFDSPTEQFPLVLNYIGKDPNSSNPDDYKAALEAMKKVRNDIKRFSSSGYIDNMAQGELCVAIGYGGDLNIAKRRAEEAGNNIHIKVLTPKSGVGIWVDSLMIPKDAKNVANAYKYINHTLDPVIAAKNSSYVTYAPSSLPAREHMDAELAKDESIFPNEQTMSHSFVVLPKSTEIMRLQNNLWLSLKANR
ncbi:polyamine ABC transporter substrate-binding protein [Kingella negevensis]|uniref:Putrescine-binding periplasmic protein n=1 Tax=Kingella negevensis TaxID=1522312 RepID=A0A238HH70_9NEIS|nr:polyamine ABC transporter substrate-binding protein [Kingella negevensis]MDK4681222.1 polyamine ABC transporter substrate-binding protein [Kingella negevensis]MDK4683419.1 polyamine ABC transporter substrate-binding protein [Kingella negevensis]MDK4685326.1 polyamine ABC transporter substrate-binding protein [Kingella negevensis]MDK4691446.1 polyamine ABC transporter substrate-binding protein [Kingella negevensis]MDK4693405.1 polyamine ABC transporter substrate-binding protein [Kingella neg